MVEPDGILNYFGWESVVFIHPGGFHGLNCRRTAINLSVPSARLCDLGKGSVNINGVNGSFFRVE